MTFATQQRAANRATVDQLDRVNGTPAQIETQRHRDDVARYMQRIVTLETEIARLQRELAAAKNPSIRPGTPPPGYTPTEPRRTYAGRPVKTVAEVAKLTGLSPSQVTRYCQSGHWRAWQDSSRTWHIDADQPFTRRTRRKRRKSK